MAIRQIDTVSLGLVSAIVVTAVAAWSIAPGQRAASGLTQRADDSEATTVLDAPHEPAPNRPLAQATDSMQETLLRPLFNPTRRPAEEKADVPVSPVFSRVTNQASDMHRLVGIVMVGDVRFAMLQNARTGKTTRVEDGGEVDGWQLESVDTESVTLKRGIESKRLTLERKSDPKTDAKIRTARLQERLRRARGQAERGASAPAVEEQEQEQQVPVPDEPTRTAEADKQNETPDD